MHERFSTSASWVREFNSEDAFSSAALDLFRYQARLVPVYKNYLELLNVAPESVSSVEEIPFLPISFFKSHQVVIPGRPLELTFSSSGTTGSTPSLHHVVDKSFYHHSFLKGFRRFYGNPEDWAFLFLLPSYLDRQGSSLVYMAEHLLARSEVGESGFFLHDFKALEEKVRRNEALGVPTLLLGVSFALLDFAEYVGKLKLEKTVVMETGGMKGRRAELTRTELHQLLQSHFLTAGIHSEYGMTELLSQAYSKGSGVFESPPWMRILIRELRDPFQLQEPGRSGAINIIDLANVNSCAFLETQDVGRSTDHHTFEVLGRMDASDIRGCNLLVD